MAETRPVGVREVLIVAAIAVGLILAAQVVTISLPDPISGILFRTPLVIVILIVGTAGLLWRIATRQPPEV